VPNSPGEDFVKDVDPHPALCCSEIPLPVSKSTGSHHLKVLREAGVVRAQIDGTRRYYTLRRDDLDARFPGLLSSVIEEIERAP
jgi:DNA-binding transcriptional ArsR family regulator